MASVAYDAAKIQARLAKAKAAHDDLISAAWRAQGDALSIESQAKIRFADEYDATQKRGEIATGKEGLLRVHPSQVTDIADGEDGKLTQNDTGVTPDEVSKAREVRDAEKKSPGVVKKTIKKALDEGREPTKAEVKRAVKETLGKSAPPPRGAPAIG
jgi:hypothetical protein